MKSTATARHAFVEGRVQGVAFRWCTREESVRRGLGGWVRNLSDGRVEVWVEGDAKAVETLVEWLHRGPGGARVNRVEILEVIPAGFETFSVCTNN